MTETPSPSELLDGFLAEVARKNLQLYPAQEEAILALYDGANVILNTPTGSGKSLVAQALHFLSLKTGKRSYYTCPIKALVNEKFLALCRDFGPVHVGMITGDATVNPDAPIICCTAEILSNLALREGARGLVADVVMDEFHYYSDRERGVAWQIPLLTLPQARFLLMSATLGDTSRFEAALTRLNGRATTVVRAVLRPVPLEFSFAEIPEHEMLALLIAQGRAPIYLVHFTQREVAENARNLMSVDVCTKEEKRSIQEAIGDFRFDSPYGKEFHGFLRHGIGIHHAGLLPKYRVLVEKLAQRGLLKIICGTDTLGVGVNIPLRTVLFTKLCKYDGTKSALLSVRDFHQISGRAGRKGFDDRGYVVVQAPEHIIENKRLDEKQAATGKKFVKRKPPEKGYIPWDRNIYNRLLTAEPEPLTSQFQLTHGMLLNVLARETEDGCRAMRQIIRDSHETPENKKTLFQRGFALFRSLVDRRIVEFAVTSGPRKRVVLNLDLQQDFSLNQTLSLYLLDTLKLLDRDEVAYPLNVLSLAESILENPDIILRKQVDRLKTEKMAEMKMNGVEYDDRINELEKIEHPKPLREFTYETFNAFADAHPWVGVENIRPKSVAREMFEGFYSFGDYIREYELQRAEGVLLRYLSETYKVLVQTLPAGDKTDAIEEMVTYLQTMLRATDSSLVDEWERLRNPDFERAELAVAPVPQERPFEALMRDRSFRIQVKNVAFQVVRALARGDRDAIARVVTFSDAAAFEKAGFELQAEHPSIDVSPRARNPALFQLSPDGRAEQGLSDFEGPLGWVLKFEVRPEESVAARTPIVRLLGLEKI